MILMLCCPSVLGLAFVWAMCVVSARISRMEDAKWHTKSL